MNHKALKIGVVLFFVFQAIGVVRSFVTEDNRWGWGMFSESVRYRMQLVQGDRVLPPWTGPLASKIGKMQWNQVHATHYGFGAAEKWWIKYAEFLRKHRSEIQLPEGTEMVVEYQRNQGEREVIRYKLNSGFPKDD